jgi:uroporphyrinogen-III synthase
MGPWVLATRALREVESLARLLAARGLTVLPYPVLRETPSDDPGAWALVAGLRQEVRCVVFTSRRAVPASLAAAEKRALRPWLLSCPIAAVGEATAAVARRSGFSVAVVGDAGGEALAVQLTARLAAGSAVLHPCGREHREELGVALAARGIRVVPVVVYAMDETPAEDLPALPPDLPRAVLLTSPRATRAYWRASGGCYAAVAHFALGATTAATAGEMGIAARVVAGLGEEGIVEELCRRW